MRENRLRVLWKADHAAVNGWLAIPNSFAAETMAHQGWDTLTVDLQHGVVDYSSMVTMLQAIDHILDHAKAHGLVAGIHNGRPDVAKARIAKGFRFVTVSSDARILAAGSRQLLGEMRQR